MKTACRLLCLTALCCMAWADVPFQAVINDIVTPKVVSVKVTAGNVPASGTLLVAKRNGKKVATLKLRTPTGICNVESGTVKKGDLVFLSTASTAVVVDPGEKPPLPSVQDDAVKTYSQADDIADESLRGLLEAEGLLITAAHLASLSNDGDDAAFSDQVQKGKKTLKRLQVAKSVLALSTPRERVVAELLNAGKTTLATSLTADQSNLSESPAPVLPELARTFPLNRYGQAGLISRNLALWKTPRFWGETPIDPNFSGWTFSDNEVSLTKNADALIRHDLLLDDMEVTGQIKIESGISLFVILRNEVVIKFIHESAECGVAMKAGYNNLRFVTSKGSCKLLERNRWYTYRIRLVGDQVTVELDGDKVLEAGVRLTRDDMVTLPSSGYVGLGTYYGNGRFKDVQVKALSRTGRSSIPVFKQSDTFSKAGAPVTLLDGKQAYASIYGTKVQSHRRVHHAVADGTLTFTGSPFAQFTTKDLAMDNYRVSGKLRIQGEGNLWFRMNERLLFGVSAMKPIEDRDPNEHVFFVKYRLGNYLSYDHGFAGTPLRPGEWYEWELEYTHPAASLKINGRQVALASCPLDETPSAGWNHFGISAYNVNAQCRAIQFQPLQADRPDMPSKVDISALYRQAESKLKAFAVSLKPDDSGKQTALAIIRGEREPVIADSDDFKTVAVTFRQANNWPLYLTLLEENYRRFDEKTPARKAAESVWRVARQKFDIAQELLEPGDMGLDNIVRLGKSSAPVAAGEGTGVWYYLKGAKRLQLLNPETRSVVRQFNVTEPIARIENRGDYLLVFGEENKTIRKVDAQSGKLIKSVTVANGQILDWAGAPGALSFVSVDENAVNELAFKNFVIYALNEETMTLYNSGGFGQTLAMDPYGRYLYSGIFVQAGGPMKQFDPSPVRPVPVGMSLDHLMCFSVSDQDLSLISDRAAPGVKGKALAVPASGRFVCYVGERGFRRDSRDELLGDRVGAFGAGRVTRTVNSFNCGGRPSLMAFNPVQPVAYIYNGSEIRSFKTTDFEQVAVYRVPSQSVTGSGTALTVDKTGRHLYFAYNGQPGGIAVFNVREATGAAAGDPETLLADAKALMKQEKPAEAEAVLTRMIETVLFSKTGEEAAGLLLQIRGSVPNEAVETPLTFSVDAWGKTTPPATIKTPAESKFDTHRPPLNDEFKAVVDELQSFRSLAKPYPLSWRFLCLDALRKQPGNLEILLLLADSSFVVDKPDLGKAFAEILLKRADKKGYFAVKAYSLLASAATETARKLHFLKRAESLAPRNPFIHKRLGRAFATAGLSSHSEYHLRMSVHLFPSQPDLWDELIKAGHDIPLPATEEREIDDLYTSLAPSAVMIRHSAGVGTGFFITRDGLLLTNHHVIGDNASSWTVHMTETDGTKHKLPAKLVSSDARLDIAVLSVELGAVSVEPMILADPKVARTGMRTIAIGNPGMGTEVLTRTVTEGIISNVNQRVGGQYYIQTSAAVNPGNSGGPLLNRQGLVIGMVTLKASLDNVGFAIPTKRLFTYLEDNLN